jgi:hypothetical protein
LLQTLSNEPWTWHPKYVGIAKIEFLMNACSGDLECVPFFPALFSFERSKSACVETVAKTGSDILSLCVKWPDRKSVV